MADRDIESRTTGHPIGCGFGLWAALHYFLAAFGLKRSLDQSRREAGDARFQSEGDLA